MKDLLTTEKQIEIFCAFIIDFNKLNTTVSKMITSSNDLEKQRVNKIFQIITSFISETTSTEDIINNLNIETTDERTASLLNYVKTKLNNNSDESYQLVINHYNKLKNNINTKTWPKKILIKEIDDVLTITADPSVPISNEDLSFLNKIAKLSVSNTAEIREANKEFKSITFKNKLDDLYCSKAYYFEQVFANTDVAIQRKLLEILVERQHIRLPNTEEIEALKSLQDINTLSDIDTLSIKTSSNVSDHQAFDAFSKILQKNNNPNIIKKVLKENIIMAAMFKTNANTISPYYGLKKLFISAVPPYDDVIIKRYMQLMKKDDFDIAEIIEVLCKDPEFKLSYDVYHKGEETKLFLDFAEKTIRDISLNRVDKSLLSKVIQVIKGFINRENYSYSIFPQDYMFNMLNDIYCYTITNNLFDNKDLMQAIDDYQYTRISADLIAKTNPYTVSNNQSVYDITSGDLWFELHKMIYQYNIDWINRYYLKYNEIDMLTFEPHARLKSISNLEKNLNPNYLSTMESLINCSESGSKNFDMYLYDVLTRNSKNVFNSRITMTIKKIEGSGFRKKEFPGIPKTDESKIRKALTDIIAFRFLASKDPRFFTNLYKRKITTVLRNILSVKSSYEDIIQFVDAKELSPFLDIFKSKEYIEVLLQKATRYKQGDETDLLVKHSEDFLNLIPFTS